MLLRAEVISQGSEHPASGGTATAGTKRQEAEQGEAFVIQRHDGARGTEMEAKQRLCSPEQSATAED